MMDRNISTNLTYCTALNSKYNTKTFEVHFAELELHFHFGIPSPHSYRNFQHRLSLLFFFSVERKLSEKNSLGIEG